MEFLTVMVLFVFGSLEMGENDNQLSLRVGSIRGPEVEV